MPDCGLSATHVAVVEALLAIRTTGNSSLGPVVAISAAEKSSPDAVIAIRGPGTASLEITQPR